MSERSTDRKHLRGKLAPWSGKRVVVGTRTDHYLCGTLTRIERDEAVFQIRENEHRLALVDVDTVRDASPFQTDFFK